MQENIVIIAKNYNGILFAIVCLKQKIKIMTTIVTNSQLVEELNDLIEIQNDRISGYEKALEDVKEKNQDLKALFNKYIETSRKHHTDLSGQIVSLGGEVASGTTVAGKIYRAWMDVKAAFAGKDRESVLESCKYGEEAAQKAYDMALASDAEMSAEVRKMLTSQQAELKNQQNEVSNLEETAD